MAARGPGTPAPLPHPAATLAVCVACGGGLAWCGQVDGIARCGSGGRRPSRRAR